MKTILLVSLAIASCCASSSYTQTKGAQSSAHQRHPAISERTVDYSRGAFLGTRQIRIFEDDPRQFRFILLTSWIPGHEHKGFFRYQLSVAVLPVPPSPNPLYSPTPPQQGWGVSETIDRLHNCTLFLSVYDDGGFVLQKIPLILQRTVDDQSVIVGLSANDSSQMDLKDYQNFLSANPQASWNIEWACPDKN